MEKRFLLALLLTGVVLVITPILFPSAPPPPPPSPTVAVQETPAPEAPTLRAANERTDVAGSPADVAPGAGAGRTPAVSAPVDTVVVTSSAAEMTFSSQGGVPIAVTLPKHRALTSSGKPDSAVVVLRDPGRPLLSYRVITGRDTIGLARMVFRTARDAGAGRVRFDAAGGTAASIEYTATETEHLTHVRVRVDAPGRSYLLVGLPQGFESQEADTVDDIRHLAYAAKPLARGAKAVTFASLEPRESEIVPGPLSWAVAKSKYFIVAALAPTDSVPFAELQVTGGPRESKLATQARGEVVIPMIDGIAEFLLYAGPQSWERMRALGREFETANPYGGFMQPVVQPFATIVMRLMLWLKQVVRLDYGWVLVIFGVAIRIVLWPLNQSAMRASIRLQRIQPALMAVQERYKSDRMKQQQELMRVYQEHGMSPFSALSGCLPALIPMPVFFALFFVFQNTIEFRGVPFLWLADISLRDPYYILPIVTGLSMFVLSWIGMRNMPKNPQATMLLYLMPGMFTVFLLSTASGLSIYYLVQQIAAIPQQWMIANERQKAQPKAS